MRFCDLFISYKASLKDIKSNIPFTKLPLYRKVFFLIMLFFTILSGIFWTSRLLFFPSMSSLIYYIPLLFVLLTFLLFLLFDSKKNNIIYMLENHYIPYSESRISSTIKILEQYNINLHDLDSIDMLIAEAKLEQAQVDYISQLKQPLKPFSAIIIPLLIFISKEFSVKVGLKMSLLITCLVLLFISLIYSLVIFTKAILYREYNKYEYFISDLRQIKIFYTGKSPIKRNYVCINSFRQFGKIGTYKNIRK